MLIILNYFLTNIYSIIYVAPSFKEKTKKCINNRFIIKYNKKIHQFNQLLKKTLNKQNKNNIKMN